MVSCLRRLVVLARSALFDSNLNLEVREIDGNVLANSPVLLSDLSQIDVHLRLETGQLLRTHITESKKPTRERTINDTNDNSAAIDERQKIRPMSR